MKQKSYKAEWYIEGEKQGRTTAELKDLIETGQLSPNARVKWAGEERWLSRAEAKMKIADLTKGRGRADRRLEN